MQENTAKKLEQTIDKQDVLNFLEANTEFFLDHVDLFEKMTLPRKKGGTLASFSDFQNAKLTQKITQLEKRSKRIMATAIQNIESANQINKLTIDLLRSPNKESMMNHFRNVIEDELGLDSAQVILKSENNVSYEDLCVNVFRDGRNVVLRTSDSENVCLHSGGGDNCIQSEALIRLTNTHGDNFGILTLGSRDIGRFHEGQGIDLLEFLGSVISYKLEEFITYKG